MASDNRKNERKPEDVPLGTGLADRAKRLLMERKEQRQKRLEQMNKKRRSD